jgi:hypothetical protein
MMLMPKYYYHHTFSSLSLFLNLIFSNQVQHTTIIIVKKQEFLDSYGTVEEMP